MSQDILFSREGAIGFITLQRVQALNALSLSMIQALQQQLLDWQEDDHIHAVIIQAAPGKAFCAGGDVRWLYEAGKKEDPHQMQFFWHEYRLNYFIHQFSKPYIALMDGITMGGGVGISMHGSHPVATERFVFAMPETGIGFFPDIGASYLLSRCPDSYGPYLGLTGHSLHAHEAKTVGLVKHVIASEKIPMLIEQLLKLDLSHEAHVQIDACLKTMTLEPTDVPSLAHASIIQDCFGQDSVELICDALENQTHEWGQNQRINLSKKSPISLKVTLAQLQKAKHLEMADCIKMDYCLSQHFMKDVDFYEGVRALLVDKDKNPHWQPHDLKQVSQQMVDRYFECGQRALPLTIE